MPPFAETLTSPPANNVEDKFHQEISVNNGSAILLFYLIVRDHELALHRRAFVFRSTLVAQINKKVFRF